MAAVFWLFFEVSSQDLLRGEAWVDDGEKEMGLRGIVNEARKPRRTISKIAPKNKNGEMNEY